MTFRPEDREESARILRELTPASHQEPGCINYIPHRVESEPATILLYER
jgi:quinol monooxygenase YgiN